MHAAFGYSSSQHPIHMRASRQSRLSALLAIAAIASASGMVLFRSLPSLRLRYAAASIAWRPVLGRVSGVAYAKAPKDFVRVRAKDEFLRLRSISASILAKPDRDPGTSALALLLRGDSSQAVAALEKLTADEPNSVEHWSDLSAAELQVATESDDIRSDARALVAADHALTLDPVHAAGRFNRALALEALGLRFAAADGWRRYLEIDPSSGWAGEARERLRTASAPTRDEAWKIASLRLDQALDRQDGIATLAITRQFPLHTRTRIESEFLPAWGRAFLASDVTQARAALARARDAASALKAINGDSLLDEAVHAIDMIDPAMLAHAARGVVAYGNGRDANAARHVAESLQHFEEAQRELARIHNPLERAALYFRANALVDLGDHERAAALANELDALLRPSDRSLRAHAAWLRARLTNDAGRHYESLLATRDAVARFTALGEFDYADRLRGGEAAMLARLGRDTEAWHCRGLSLAGVSAAGKWNLIETAIEAIAREEIDGPDRDIARSLFEIQASAPSALPLMRFNGLLWRAYVDSSGTPDFTAARHALARIPDDRQRADAKDELWLAAALAERERTPAAAERMLGDVLAYRNRVGLLTYVPAIHLQRARLRRSLSRGTEAEEDLRAAIAIIESRRTRIRDETLRDAFLGNAQDVYDELTDLLLDRGDWRAAFDIAEHARARVLLDVARRMPIPLQELAAAMPADIVAAHYTLLRSRTLVVTIEHGRISHFVVAAGKMEFEADRARLLRALNRREDAKAEVISRRLYDEFIAPFRVRLAPDRLLVIVPDDAMSGLPFAILRGSDGRFLIEEAPIAIAPAAAALTNPRIDPPILNANVIVLADPSFSTRLFPELGRLPAAREEAASMQALFRHTTVYLDDHATPGALARSAEASDILHIGAHALSSERDASFSLFALAARDGNEGVVTLRDIESLSLPRHPLVVLAGCETAAFGGGKGSIRSLANAFLAGGSRAVLATLWNVDDEQTRRTITAFYRAVVRGESVPFALREAQLAEFAKHPSSAWGAFEIYVGILPQRENASHVPLNQ
ncbi:MAG TPA: CHAT domain-containing protein [Thermoanaerobaculia bacterium]|nr:CHAT domain-containing protein [Thermoanaerobaculia bacterium]